MTRRKWPEQFPISRALTAFCLMPMVGTMGVFGSNWIWNILMTPGSERSLNLRDLDWVFLALVYSWPAYAFFLIVGLPTMYFYFRQGWSRFEAFAFAGAVYAAASWIIFGLGPSTLSVKQYILYRLSELSVLIPIGAVCGILTRLIIIGCG
jgi:uncharacterized BrkB/YihY/UPF0761 family membrane protein